MKMFGFEVRQLALAAAMVATLAAAIWLETREGALEEPALPQKGRGSSLSSNASAMGGEPLSANQEQSSPRVVQRPSWEEPNLAGQIAWGVPPVVNAPPPPAPVVQHFVPPAPSAPVFAYALIGLMEKDGVLSALLSAQQGALAVRAGELIEGQWKVQQIDAAGLRLTWIPGNQTQFIPLKSQ